MSYKRQLLEKADKHLITSMVSKLQPVVVDRASGCNVWDVDGTEYLDCFSGISVTNVGHAREEIVEAAMEQARRLVHACTYVYHVPKAIELAAKLAEISPNKLEKTFFGNSGAEAVECSLKLARKFTKRHEFLALQASFHGRTLGCLSVTGHAIKRRYDMGPYLSGVAFAPVPYTYRSPFGEDPDECGKLCALAVRDIIDLETSNDVAAMIAEPVLGEGGIIVPPDDYFKILKEVLEERNILFIADEVQTGFGRTGELFAIEHYGIEPEVMTMAKGIAGGFPLGACIVRADVGDSFEPGDHLSTFGGNPICAAAALVNIEIILREKLPERAAETGEYLISRLRELSENHTIIGEVRGRGLMVGIELVKDERKTPAKDEAQEVRERMREEGVLIGVGGVLDNVVRLQPPLIIATEDIDRTVEALDRVLSTVGKA
ncbi:MAG: aspartate aminotransferase family protein [Candidatus Geothermarchaeales archaeon]